MQERCPNCDTALVGTFCHGCGQPRFRRLTLRDFLDDVVRRVLRWDRAFLNTFLRMLREPGALVVDYLEGRRRGILDPLHYFISSVFVQLIAGAAVRSIAPIMDRASALNWLGRIGGIVAVKILVIFWLATIWRVLFRKGRYNLGEVYVFSTYVFGTVGLLWSAMPLVDLLVPLPLGTTATGVALATLAIEFVYLTYAVRQFSQRSLLNSAARLIVVLGLGYAVLFALTDLERLTTLLLPPLPQS